jgi:glyoxylase-like metal-dependent hydrolase (beta-lactamase superfamily II)
VAAVAAPTDPAPAAPRPLREEAQPASTDVTEVAPGVLRLQLPITMPGLGHVNCYALEDERGVTVVDPGLPGRASWTSLLDRFTRAGFGLDDVHSVVVTHSHVDHFGGSGRLRVEAGASVITSKSFRTWWDPDDTGDDVDALSEVNSGVPWGQKTPWGGEHPRPPLKVRLRYRLLKPIMRRWFATPQPSVRLDDAEVISIGRRDWVAVHTPGHTPDHLCLFDPAGGVLLSGDHVLPTITPHISGVDAGDDPLTEFFASLERMHELEGVQHVLPAHGHPFTDLHGRVKDIHRHHEERLATLRGAIVELGEASVESLSERLFKPRSWGSMAQSETYAHLEHLRFGGEVDRREVDGHLLYRMA